MKLEAIKKLNCSVCHNCSHPAVQHDFSHSGECRAKGCFCDGFKIK